MKRNALSTNYDADNNYYASNVVFFTVAVRSEVAIIVIQT